MNSAKMYYIDRNDTPDKKERSNYGTSDHRTKQFEDAPPSSVHLRKSMGQQLDLSSEHIPPANKKNKNTCPVRRACQHTIHLHNKKMSKRNGKMQSKLMASAGKYSNLINISKPLFALILIL